MRGLPLILFLASALAAAPRAVVDDTNPRSPGTPLEVVYRPYYCAACLEEGILEGEPQEVRMMRLPVEELARTCEVPKPWFAIQTPHFKVFSNLRRTKVRPDDGAFLPADLERLKTIFPKVSPTAMAVILGPHERAHLYHIRAERIYAHFAALMDCKERYLGMPAPYELYVFDDYHEHHILADRFIGRSNDKAGLQHHDRAKPNFMLFTIAESQVPGGDQALANTVVHNVAHNLVDGYGDYIRETWAFLEEGLGHYYERRESPRYNTFCWTEGRAPTMFQKPNWESTILNLVRRGKDAPLSQWCEKVQPGELDGIEQGLCWSIVRWMIETDPIRFARMVEKLQDYKNKPTGSECIEYAFGMSPSALHARWREYVLDEYAQRR